MSQQYWLLLAVAPIVEETVFRAGLQNWLLGRGGAAARHSVVIVAFAFALAHVAQQCSWSALATAVPALAIGMLYVRRRSVVACSALHSACNAVWLSLGTTSIAMSA